ncbi:signal recognition particle 9 kDa protein-domain-containing protein [Geopyxis carbonaria]|nr:signal recognition particle 9 kDa protein-domain-containing protein [Geopyxis carbonaria]
MKLFTTPQDFTTAALALLTAAPTSTKITTSYHASTPGKGLLTLKCFDPVSGAVLKYRTHRVADVGRVMGTLAQLARRQAGVPEPEDDGDVTMAGAVEAVVEKVVGAVEKVAEVVAGTGAGGATKGKKKKGKGKK